MKKNKLTAFLMNPYTVTSFSIIMPLLISSIITSIKKGVNIITALMTVLRTILKWFWKIFTFPIPVWIILMAIAVLIVLRIAIMNFEKKQAPPFLKYNEQKYKGVLYTWDYKKSSSGKYEINGIAPVCEKCRCLLVQRYRPANHFHNGGYLTSQTLEWYCPQCDKFFNIVYTHDEKEELAILITNNIHNDKYKLLIEKSDA